MAFKHSIDAKKLKKVLKKFTDNFEIDLSREINNSAGTIIKDMKERSRRSLDINDNSLEPLAESTIKAKRKKNYKKPSHPLIATGTLTGGLGEKTKGAYLKKRATPTNQLAIISAPTKKAISSKGRFYGQYHQGSNRNKKLEERKFFGVSRDAEADIEKAMEKRINRIING